MGTLDTSSLSLSWAQGKDHLRRAGQLHLSSGSAFHLHGRPLAAQEAERISAYLASHYLRCRRCAGDRMEGLTACHPFGFPSLLHVFFALFVKISAQGGTFPVHRSSPSTKNPQTAMCWSFADFLLVIRMGLEPMTRSLEGCCSNPTELPNHPFCFSLSRESA